MVQNEEKKDCIITCNICIITWNLQSSTDESTNNLENSLTTKIDDYIPCKYSMSTILGIWSHRKEGYFIS